MSYGPPIPQTSFVVSSLFLCVVIVILGLCFLRFGFIPYVALGRGRQLVQHA